MSWRLRLIAGLIAVVLIASAAIVYSIGFSRTPTLVGVWGGHQCAQLTVAHPLAVPNEGRGHFGGLPYPATVDASMRIDTLLQTTFTALASGVTLSNNNATINVYTIGTTPYLRAEVTKLAPKDSVAYFKCDNTLFSIRSIQRALLGWDTSTNQGIDIAGFNGDIISNCEEIDVVNLTHAQLALLQRRYGSGKICVHGITPQQLPAAI